MITFLAILGAIALLAIAIIYSTLSWVLVGYKFWYWFVLPVFTSLPHVDYWSMVGLMFFIGLFKNRSIGTHLKKEFKDKDSEYKEWTAAVVAPWLVLLIGYVTHLLIS